MVVAALLPGILGARQTTFINNGFYDFINDGSTVTPPINAVTFINNGTFVADTVLPFETANTLNFTNIGTMETLADAEISGGSLLSGGIGWLFDDSPSSVGQRRSAANFFNGNLGIISTPVFLTVWATNIINTGQFDLGPFGRLELVGSSLDLRQSVMEVSSVSEDAEGSKYSNPGTNTFTPDLAIYDLYWVQTNFYQNYTLNVGSVWINSTATALGVPSPPAEPNAIAGFSIGSTNIQVLPAYLITNTSFLKQVTVANSYYNTNSLQFGPVTLTNMDGSPGHTLNLFTNINKGAVFVFAPPFLSVQTRFEPGVSNFDAIDVQLSTTITNAIDQSLQTDYIFVQDNLASAGANGVLMANSVTPDTFRPTNYYVDRLSHSALFVSPPPPNVDPGLGVPEANFFVDSGNILNYPKDLDFDMVTNEVATSGAYAAYSAFIDNVAARPPPVLGGNITNLPGTLRIIGKDVDLTQARLRAEGQVVIQAVNLLSSSNALVDCENLSFDLGSKSGFLKVQDLAGTSVSRLRGTIRMWSATWSNAAIVVAPDNYASNATTGGLDEMPLTNTIAVGYDVMILDASGLTNTLPVSEYVLNLHGTQIELDDDMTVLQQLFIDGRTFTVNGAVVIPGAFPPANPINNQLFPGVPLKEWVGTNAPAVLFLTNNGTISVFGEGHFGDDRPPYATFVNAGSLVAGGLQLRSGYFENDGVFYAYSGPMVAQAGSALLRNGFGSSASYAQITAGNLLMSNYQLASGDRLDLTVTNMLSDGGVGAGNSIQVQNGFNLMIKPQTGDLLGTTIKSSAPRALGETVSHTWSGQDRGATPAGYTNNCAVGTLALSAVSASSQFVFSGTGGAGVTNGLYVDLLDLTGLGANIGLNQIQISPNLVIYYAAVKVATNHIVFPLGAHGRMEAEEFLNGNTTNQLGGHLRWVRDYAGANSSTNVLINGSSASINAALRNSKNIDTGGTGIFNSSKTNFPAALVGVQISGNGTLAPDYSGQLLLLGESYAMVAQPSAGSTFAGWTGSTNSSAPQLTFVVTNGLSYVANFTFPASASYSGLFYQSNGVEFLKSGAIAITTTKGGNYTGTLRIGGNRYSIGGQFNTNNTARTSVGPYSLQLELTDDQIIGTVSNATFSAGLELNRSVFNGTTSKAPFAGKYTIVFRGSENPFDREFPQGDGIGAVTVSASGAVQLSGSLADGTAISQTATASKDGQWPLYVSLYNGNGQILGWLSFTNVGNLVGPFSWIREPNVNAAFYTNGFVFETNAVGLSYVGSLAPVTVFTRASLFLEGGNLSQAVGGQVNINPNNTVVHIDNSSLAMTLNQPQGLFSGSVRNPVSGKTVNFKGALLQNDNFGSGYFLGTNLSGRVTFGP